MPSRKLRTETCPQPHEAAIPLASRASWSGQLQLQDGRVPVKAYPAAVTTRSSALCQLHAGCGQRIEYRKCCPVHGTVPAEDIAKGYPYAADELIELSEPDLARLEPEDQKTILLERFFDPQQFDLTLLSGRSFHLVPAHPAAQAVYGALILALQQCQVWALGTMVLSGRRQLLVVQPLGRQLRLYLLHWPAQRRACPVIPEAKAAASLPLVQALETTVSEDRGPVLWEQYADDWDAQLAALVQEKIAERAAAAMLPLERKQPRARTRTRSSGTGSRKRSAARSKRAA